MNDIEPFAVLLLLTAAVGLVAILSNHVTTVIRIPTPGLFLVGAAIAVRVVPELHAPHERTVLRIVTVALLMILFDGGMHIGWSRFSRVKGTVSLVGVVGTFLTTGAVAVLGHLVLGLGWYPALLVATAVAPTDPAVVFSVLGRREVAGKSSIILEGESGANDPVGIALMASLIAAGGVSASALSHTLGQFTLQMVVGVVVGVIGGSVLLWFMRRVPLANEGLYPLRTVVGVLALYGLAAVAHGSGFLAVFVAGIMIGDQKAPYKGEIRHFHAALASVSEIIAFVVLGLTVDLSVIARTDVWVPGLVIALTLAIVVRPVCVGLCLIPARMRPSETTFVLFAGLKGAVPILLGSYLLVAHIFDAPRLYGIVVVVVVFSVFVQATLTPSVASRLRVPMRLVNLEPWTLGMRLAHEPENVHRITVASGAPADGCRIADLDAFPDDSWISLAVRGGQVLQLRGGTSLQGGDQLLILAPSDAEQALMATFTVPD